MAIAAVDWVAVGRGLRRAEAVLKPLVPVPLIAVALLAHAWWFAAALALCLAGDVLLLPQVDRFRSGLAAFLLGHLAFIAGFLHLPVFTPGLAFVAVDVLMLGFIGSKIVTAAPPQLRAPVAAYVVVIAAMVGVAVSRAAPILWAGAVLFALSDGVLGWNRFLQPLPGGRVAVMVTYHLAIGLLTLSLLI